jgi:hypothetical protein
MSESLTFLITSAETVNVPSLFQVRHILFPYFPNMTYKNAGAFPFLPLFSLLYVSFYFLPFPAFVVTRSFIRLMNKSFNSFDFAYCSQWLCIKKFTVLPECSDSNLALLHKAILVLRMQRDQANLSGKSELCLPL